MTERYAIYFAPAEQSLLWHRASTWIGRDSINGEVLPQPEIGGISRQRLEDVTESARRYGFHATLRSPFRLSETCNRNQLIDSLARYAKGTAPVDLGTAEIRSLSGFLAIMPVQQSEVLTDFASDCVAYFERCRAPLTEAERARRLGAGLTERQVELVDLFGYPYVMEEFRFHMTLTDRLDDADRAIIQPAADAYFAEALAAPLVVDRVVLYHEPEPGAPFFRLEDFVLAGAK